MILLCIDLPLDLLLYDIGGFRVFMFYKVVQQHIVGVVCMPVSSKFLTESTGVKIVKIGQYLAKIRAKHDSLVFFGPPCIYNTRYGGQAFAPHLFLQHEKFYYQIPFELCHDSVLVSAGC